MAERHVAGPRLSAFLDDELAEDRALEVTGHLSRCTACRAELESLRATRVALRGLPGLQAPVLTGSVVARSRRRRRLARRWRRAALVALVPLAVLTGAWVAGAEQGEVAPSTDRFLVEHVARTGGGPVPVPVVGR